MLDRDSENHTIHARDIHASSSSMLITPCTACFVLRNVYLVKEQVHDGRKRDDTVVVFPVLRVIKKYSSKKYTKY